jgi:hypothetical protein
VRLAIGAFVSTLLVTVTNTASAAYAHRWTWKTPPDPAVVEKCVAEMKVLASRRAGDLELETSETTEAHEIRFNGRSDLAQEKFVFPGSVGFNAVRTEGKPYDAVVTASLITARTCFSPDTLEIASDGDWVDWREGRLLWEEVHGTMAANPGIADRHGFAPGGKLVLPPSTAARDPLRKPWAIVVALCIAGLIVLMLVPTKKDPEEE